MQREAAAETRRHRQGTPWVWGGLIVCGIIASVTLLAVTDFLLLRDGTGALVMLRPSAALYDWPTFVAVAAVIVIALVGPASMQTRRIVYAGVAAWLVTGIGYGVSTQPRTPSTLAVSLLVAGIPILAVTGTLRVTHDLGATRGLQLVLGLAVGLLATWLMLPMFIIVLGAVGGIGI